MTTGLLSGTSATPLVIAAHGTRLPEGQQACRALSERVKTMLPGVTYCKAAWPTRVFSSSWVSAGLLAAFMVCG